MWLAVSGHPITFVRSALNFLHLQYSPPVALDTILSADLMQKFERVTDFLLSLLHGEQHVVTLGLYAEPGYRA